MRKNVPQNSPTADTICIPVLAQGVWSRDEYSRRGAHFIIQPDGGKKKECHASGAGWSLGAVLLVQSQVVLLLLLLLLCVPVLLWVPVIKTNIYWWKRNNIYCQYFFFTDKYFYRYFLVDIGPINIASKNIAILLQYIFIYLLVIYLCLLQPFMTRWFCIQQICRNPYGRNPQALLLYCCYISTTSCWVFTMYRIVAQNDTNRNTVTSGLKSSLII